MPTHRAASLARFTICLVITAYLIANTSITALYGKISESQGRRVTLLIRNLALYDGRAGLRARSPHGRLILGRRSCTGRRRRI